MYNLNWSRDELQNRQKLGTFGEYYAKMRRDLSRVFFPYCKDK